MSESPVPAAQPTTEPTTGLPSADAVVESLGALDGLPVGEHVAVFEAAHRALGQLLSGPPAD
jgi:hypothetical protein